MWIGRAGVLALTAVTAAQTQLATPTPSLVFDAGQPKKGQVAVYTSSMPGCIELSAGVKGRTPVSASTWATDGGTAAEVSG